MLSSAGESVNSSLVCVGVFFSGMLADDTRILMVAVTRSLVIRDGYSFVFIELCDDCSVLYIGVQFIISCTQTLHIIIQ